MSKQVVYTNFNDRFSQQAAAVAAEAPRRRAAAWVGKPAPSPVRAESHTPAAEPSIPVLSAEELKKLTAAGLISKPFVPPPHPGDGSHGRRGGELLPRVTVPIQPAGRDLVGFDGVRAQLMVVTPELATYWLRNNFGNRPVKEDVVDAYARDMASGRFVTTHQGVAFNDKDELIDGQHRLLAVVKSGFNVTLMVTFGLPSQIEGTTMTTMDAVDRGVQRSVADQLKIQHGMKHGSLIAAVTRSVAGVCCSERTKKLTVGQTLDIYEAFGPAIDYVIEKRSKHPGLKQAGVMAGFAFAITAAPATSAAVKLQDWFVRLVADEQLDELPALAKLRSFLTSDEAVLLSRGHDRALAELTLQALRVQQLALPIIQVAVATEGRDYYRAMIPETVEKVAVLFRLPTHS